MGGEGKSRFTQLTDPHSQLTIPPRDTEEGGFRGQDPTASPEECVGGKKKSTAVDEEPRC
jgi:hypothetical protein